MKKYTLLNFLLAVVLLISATIMPVFAANQNVYSLTVTFQKKDKTLIEGANFRVYDAFDVNGNLKGKFANLGVTGNAYTVKSLDDFAKTLSPYTGDITAYKKGTTDQNGEIKFDNLPRGVYLVVGDAITKGDYTYTPMPFIINVPNSDNKGNLVKNVVSYVKYDEVESTKRIDVSVKKVWDDKNYSKRPTSVKVQLLRDGKAYGDVVTLNNGNKWTHTWERLDASHKWEVREEEIPEGYKVTITPNNYEFTITNKGDFTTPPPSSSSTPSSSSPSSSSPSSSSPSSSSPSSSGSSSSDPTTQSSTPSETTKPESSSTPDSGSTSSTGLAPSESESSGPSSTPDSGTSSNSTPSSESSSTPESGSGSSSTSSTAPVTPPSNNSTPPKLPQTGQLWWPVPIMLISGFIFLLAGIVVSKLHEDEKKA